jgi:hypothetical protein
MSNREKSDVSIVFLEEKIENTKTNKKLNEKEELYEVIQVKEVKLVRE